MASRRFLATCFAGLALCATTLPVFAETLLRPVPTPDTSKLPPSVAQQLEQTRSAFNEAKNKLVGPPLTDAYALLGAAYARAGLDEVADVAFYDASQLSPSDGRWPYIRGFLARQAKRNTDARANFEAAFALDKDYMPIRYRLADTLIDLNDFDAARKVLEGAVQEHADQAVPHAMLGQLALRQKRYPEAIEQFNAALKIEPAANELYKYISDAYTAQGDTKSAQAASARAGTTPPVLADPLVAGIFRNAGAAPAANGAKPDLPPVSGNTLQQAEQLFAAGRINAAREKVGLVIQANDKDTDALTLSARIEAAANNPVIATNLIDAAVKLKPNDGNVLTGRGEVYEFAGDEARAVEFYQRAIQADTKQADAHLLLGNSEMRHGQYPQAIEQYRQVVALRPTDATAYAHLVAAQVAVGKCGDAIADINTALGKRSNDGDLLQIFVRLASTCSTAKQDERDMALDYAQTLYKLRADDTNSAALALAMAAHGKYKDAQQYQAEAIYQAVRVGDKNAAALYKGTQATFVANKVPDRPWPAEDRYFKPPLLAPLPPLAAAPPPKAK